MRLGIINMRHLIIGQVGIKIITSIKGGEESNPLWTATAGGAVRLSSSDVGDEASRRRF